MVPELDPRSTARASSLSRLATERHKLPRTLVRDGRLSEQHHLGFLQRPAFPNRRGLRELQPDGDRARHFQPVPGELGPQPGARLCLQGCPGANGKSGSGLAGAADHGASNCLL